MARIIHVRIDSRTEKLRAKLRSQMGWTDSKLIREGIRTLNALLVPQRPRKIIGLGTFRSGDPDLGTKRER